MNMGERNERRRIEPGIQACRRLDTIDDPVTQRSEQRPLAVNERVAVVPELTRSRRTRQHCWRLVQNVTTAMPRGGEQKDADVIRDPQIARAVRVGRVE